MNEDKLEEEAARKIADGLGTILQEIFPDIAEEDPDIFEEAITELAEGIAMALRYLQGDRKP